MSERLLAGGADGARGDWLAAFAYGSNDSVERIALELVPTFAGLVSVHIDGAPFVVDIPMGLLRSVGPRPCDEEARKRLGKRASTVFAPPSRPLLQAATYSDARALIEAERLTTPAAKGLSAQAFGLVPKIQEADVYLRDNSETQKWLWECHPELSFLELAGHVLPDKKSVSGQAQRLEHLAGRFPGVLAALRALDAGSRRAEFADALACLHTALRIRAGDHEVLGGGKDVEGLVMRMAL